MQLSVVLTILAMGMAAAVYSQSNAQSSPSVGGATTAPATMPTTVPATKPSTMPATSQAASAPASRPATAPATSQAVASTQPAGTQTTKAKNPVVVIETSLGTIKAELWPDKAPITVKNFLSYTDAKFYDGLIFHRVMPGFMIQGGGFSPKMEPKETRAPIKNEARADVPNQRGTLAMARPPQVDGATSQFFINVANNRGLNHRPEDFGYCVFGKVLEGMDVVDKIVSVKTTSVGPYDDVPVQPVTIISIRRAE